jgi:hypothetical protein
VSNDPDMREKSLVRLDELLSGKATFDLVSTKIDLLLNACQEKLTFAYNNRVKYDKGLLRKFERIVTYVMRVLWTAFAFPNLVVKGSLSAFEPLIKVIFLIIGEFEVIDYCKTIGGLGKKLLDQVVEAGDHTAATIALLKLRRSEMFGGIDGLLEKVVDRLPGWSQAHSVNLDLILEEVPRGSYYSDVLAEVRGKTCIDQARVL